MSGYEEQERRAALRKARNGTVARDLAKYLREERPRTASDFEDAVEQWLRDNGGYDPAIPRDAAVRRVANAALTLLASGQQGGAAEIPELGETWTISREPS